MTLLQKLVCKSVKEDLYCDGDYDRRFDQASACIHAYDNPREARKKSRSSSQVKQQSRRRPKSKGRKMQIPHAIPEQTGIQYQHPEFEELSADDFVVNAVRKTLNNGKLKSKGRRGRLCQTSDVDSISTASSLTIDMYGTRNSQYYYGDGDESDVVSEEGKAVRLAPASLNLIGGPTTTTVVPNYKSARAEEDEAEGYLEQCMGMMADLLLGEAAVPREVKQQQQQQRLPPSDVFPPIDATSIEQYTEDNFKITKIVAPDLKSLQGDSQNTYTDESSLGSYSAGQSSLEDSAGSSELGGNLFCSPL